MDKKAGYAVVGLGVGRNHAQAAAKSERADLVAVCDLLPEKLDKAAAEYPGVRTYTDFTDTEVPSVPNTLSASSASSGLISP